MTSAPRDGMTQHGDEDLLVRDRQLDLAYRRLWLSILLSLAVPPVFVWLMRPLFPWSAVLFWLGSVWLGALARSLLWYSWHRVGGDARSSGTWGTRLTMITAFAGATWSGGALRIQAGAGPSETLLLAIMIVAITAIGAKRPRLTPAISHHLRPEHSGPCDADHARLG